MSSSGKVTFIPSVLYGGGDIIITTGSGRFSTSGNIIIGSSILLKTFRVYY